MEEERAGTIADHLGGRDLRVAVAESLTGGMISSSLAKAPGASSWLAGGVVAYMSHVKHEVLGVEQGPVVTEEAALQMARGVARLLGADVAVSVTGVGGPDPEEGKPPGTVWVALCSGERAEAHQLRLEGDPPTVCRAACEEALRLLEEHLSADGG
ncbi:MAG: CinA family protein [Actinomycetota bacterium]|nr:CinA family protein [Actinomycetota bacterium]